jgi:lysophospholipid acyltransferase (LPLAT)-like uncharacterized protein
MMAALVAGLLWVLMRSWRRVWKDKSPFNKIQGPVIFCIWHNHLALALASYDRYAAAKWKGRGVAAMVSASRDGAFLAAVLQKFDVPVVRGSSSRRGPQALLEASRWLRKGYHLAITPDGPRGPAHRVQDGVIYLAQVSGRPIVPISNFVSWKMQLRSWDRFQIPLLFARCELYDNDPIWVPRAATDDEREQLRLKLEASMNEISRD